MNVQCPSLRQALTALAAGTGILLLGLLGWWLGQPRPSPHEPPPVTDAAAVPDLPTPPQGRIITEAPLAITQPQDRLLLPNRDACRLAYSPDTAQWLVLQNLSLPSPPATSPDVPPPSPTPSDTLFLYNSVGGLIKTVLGPTDKDDQHITLAIFAPGGKHVLTAGPSGALRLYNLDDSSLVWELLTKLPLQALAYSPDGKSIVLASGSNLTLVNADTHAAMFTFTGHSADITALAFVGNSQLLSASNDRTLHLWDLSSRSLLRTLQGHTQPVLAVAASPDGKYAVSGGLDARIILWNLSDGTIAWRFRVPQDDVGGWGGRVVGAVFLQDGRRLLTTTPNTGTLWDLPTRQPLVSYKFGTMGVPFVCNDERAFRTSEFVFPLFPDAEPLPGAIGPVEPTLPGRQLRILGPIAPPSGQAANPFWLSRARPLTLLPGSDGRFALAGYGGGVNPICVRWDLQTATLLSRTAFPISCLGDMTLSGIADFSSDGTLAALISAGDVHLADTATGRDLRAFPVGPIPNAVVETAVFTPNGKFLLVPQTPWATPDHTSPICIFNVSDGTLLRRLEGSTGRVLALAVSPDGARVVSGDGVLSGGPFTLRVWDFATGKQTATLEGHPAQIVALAISPDGKRALSAALSRPPILWDLDAGTELRRLNAHLNRGPYLGAAVAFSPDNRLLATGASDNDIRVYDSSTGTEITRFELHTAPITALRFLPDNKTLLSASADGTLRLWQLP